MRKDSLGNYQLVEALLLIIIIKRRRRIKRKKKKDTEKLSKYKDLKIAVSKMCEVRA